MVIPNYLNQFQQYQQAIKWLNLTFIIQLNNIKYKFKLFIEFINIYIYKQSFIFQRKQEIYKKALDNKFNKHFKW